MDGCILTVYDDYFMAWKLNVIKYGWDMGIIVVVSLLFYTWALKSGFKTEYLENGRKVNDGLKAAAAETAASKQS